MVTAPNILVVPPQSPYKTLAEFLAFAKGNAGKLSFASAGNGRASHLAGETLNDLMGNQVSCYFGNTASTLGHVKACKLRALAVGSARRVAALPDVPTLLESGLAGFTSQEWNGVLAPKGTADDVVQRLAKELRAALDDAEVKAKLTQLGLEPVGSTAAEFLAFLNTEMARAAEVVKARGIKLDRPNR